MRAAIPLAIMSALASAWVQAAVPQDIEQAFSHFNELPGLLIPILASAKDRQSAEEAAPHLQAALTKVYDARSELQHVRLTPEWREELRQKYGREMQESWGEAYRHIFRLQKTRCYDSLAFFKQFHILCMMLDQ